MSKEIKKRILEDEKFHNLCTILVTEIINNNWSREDLFEAIVTSLPLAHIVNHTR